MFHIDLKNQCLNLVKLYINITSTACLTPYETLFGRPYRLPQFKNQWETDDEANLADYMKKMFEHQQKDNQTTFVVVIINHEPTIDD